MTGNVTRCGRAPHQACPAGRGELGLFLGALDPVDLRDLELVDPVPVRGPRGREGYRPGGLSGSSLESAVDLDICTCYIGYGSSEMSVGNLGLK